MITHWRASPNWNARPAPEHPIDCVVLHADASHTATGTIDWITRKESKVSYHYLIDRDGTVYQCVADLHRAWHAGRSELTGRSDVNDFSIGVSFSNDQQGEPFHQRQLDAGVELVADLCAKYLIPLPRVVTHAAVATPPGRKHDPGPRFPLDDFLSRVAAMLARASAPPTRE